MESRARARERGRGGAGRPRSRSGMRDSRVDERRKDLQGEDSRGNRRGVRNVLAHPSRNRPGPISDQPCACRVSPGGRCGRLPHDGVGARGEPARRARDHRRGRARGAACGSDGRHPPRRALRTPPMRLQVGPRASKSSRSCRPAGGRLRGHWCCRVPYSAVSLFTALPLTAGAFLALLCSLVFSRALSGLAVECWPAARADTAWPRGSRLLRSVR